MRKRFKFVIYYINSILHYSTTILSLYLDTIREKGQLYNNISNLDEQTLELITIIITIDLVTQKYLQ